LYNADVPSPFRRHRQASFCQCDALLIRAAYRRSAGLGQEVRGTQSPPSAAEFRHRRIRTLCLSTRNGCYRIALANYVSLRCLRPDPVRVADDDDHVLNRDAPLIEQNELVMPLAFACRLKLRSVMASTSTTFGSPICMVLKGCLLCSPPIPYRVACERSPARRLAEPSDHIRLAVAPAAGRYPSLGLFGLQLHRAHARLFPVLRQRRCYAHSGR
jgi:hypothetical protein